MQPNEQPPEVSQQTADTTSSAVPAQQSLQPAAENNTVVETSVVAATENQYAESSAADKPTELAAIEPVTWQFDEYAQRDRTPLWYVVLVVVVGVLMGLAIWLSAWTFAVLIPVMVVALMVYAHRPPQLISYTVSEKGLYINDTLHPMGEFKAFAVGTEAGHNSLMFIPVKRFRPAIKVSFPDEIGERLVDIIGAYIPSQEYRIDTFDKIVQKLHL